MKVTEDRSLIAEALSKAIGVRNIIRNLSGDLVRFGQCSTDF